MTHASSLPFAPSHVAMCHQCGDFEIGTWAGSEDQYCGADCARLAEAEYCALRAEFNYKCLSSARMCDDNPAVWERRLHDAEQWAVEYNRVV